ncbi:MULTISPECIES: HlyD family efflux transporter periplasmic adaptor subunit [unclassified Coleofasciculus]|uniref:HlyD family efflux transporter periplasmic adaptor subunit n=1 Tax=unclassified Coleofasciculus TaxID=2692782 RepID=UPI0018830471|nr:MULTISPECIES: HlyD family efflux transporter periplasmic adaptor subunit [unclassified Coleofasciculus]MBE9129485.1 HlyD family efflux transporter periplasmic adaptor subunit [Coleofasciculus sp. LEGE 07081]MBE9148271.1 HlyD family efflux transporter periplasmic adaptor subunit [Coleofasciculus sp. LEGE 07092]
MNERNGANSTQSITVRSPSQSEPVAVATDTKAAPRIRSAATAPQFDRPVILQQSPVWSRAIVWALVGVTTLTIGWACVAKIEEAIPAQGKLEPTGDVKEVQAPVGGVVEKIEVEEGKRVEAGDTLLTFDQTAARAEFESLQRIRSSLVEENQFYQAQMNGKTVALDAENIPVKLPEQIASLTKNRVALMAENQYYQAQLRGSSVGLSPEQQQRLRASQQEYNSRVAAAELEVQQLNRQLTQTDIQLKDGIKVLEFNQEITERLRKLWEEGAFGELQYLQQQQQTETSASEVERLKKERERLQQAIAQAKARKQNTMALSEEELLTKIAENERQLAEIDSQLSKIVFENEKRIKEIDSQLSKTQLTLTYQELQAPASGKVFDLQAGPGFVANSSEPVLKIVPDEGLMAKVFITNRDIGFVKEGMNVDVRIDSFPYSEFGDVKGELIQIGSDALPPDEIYPFYRFPAKIRLDKQSILVNEKEISLQSGMSVSANIKVRQRTVISIFTDLFAKKLDSLKSVR